MFMAKPKTSILFSLFFLTIKAIHPLSARRTLQTNVVLGS